TSRSRSRMRSFRIRRVAERRAGTRPARRRLVRAGGRSDATATAARDAFSSNGRWNPLLRSAIVAASPPEAPTMKILLLLFACTVATSAFAAGDSLMLDRGELARFEGLAPGDALQ